MARTILRQVSPVREVTKFTCIIAADAHIREDTPRCRTDDYQAAQFRKLKFIGDLCRQNECPLLIAGDVLDFWKPSPWLLSQCLAVLPETIAVYGQHDLQAHNLEERSKTGLETLERSGRVLTLVRGHQRVVGSFTNVYGYSYGETAQNPSLKPGKRRNLLLWHVLTCETKQPFPGAEALTSSSLERELSGYDWIITGDNHQQFQQGRVLNPGSMMRMTADQQDFRPAVYGYDENANVMTRLPLPIMEGVVSREHLQVETKQDRDVRMAAYVKRASEQYESRLSFAKNLEAYIRKNKVNSETVKLLREVSA